MFACWPVASNISRPVAVAIASLMLAGALPSGIGPLIMKSWTTGASSR
jgi:hypothetical protein